MAKNIKPVERPKANCKIKNQHILLENNSNSKEDKNKQLTVVTTNKTKRKETKVESCNTNEISIEVSEELIK